MYLTPELIVTKDIYGYLFLIPKNSMLLCRLMVQMGAGDLLLRDFPVLRIRISPQGMVACLDHR